MLQSSSSAATAASTFHPCATSAASARSDGDPNTVSFTGIVANPSTDGIATLTLTNSQTDALKTRGRYVYDVEFSFVDSDSNTIIERVLEGNIEVSPSVTKP